MDKNMKKTKLDNEFMNLIDNIKRYDNNPIAFGEMIELVYTENKNLSEKSLKEFKIYKRTAEYPTKLKLAIIRIREMVRCDINTVKEQGFQSSEKYVDKDFLEMWQKRLLYLEKEAKHFKIEMNKMRVNLAEEFDKHLKLVKEKKDHMAFAFALEESVKNKKNAEKIDKFRNDPIYKEILLKSLKRFREIVEEENKDIAEYGYGASEHYVDKDLHLSNKRRLKLLQKEAKRLKI